jgi:hypothetical protein
VTNDGPAIQAAIDAAAPSHGTVFFPEGTYQLVLPAAANRGAITARAGVTLRGPGAVLRTNTVGRTDYGVLVGVGDTATPAPGVTIRDLTFDGMANDNTIGYEWTMGLQLYAGAADTHITGAHFRFLAGDGVDAGQLAPAAGVTRVTIDHNEAFKVSGQAFMLSGTDGNVQITDNSVHDNMQIGGLGHNIAEAIWSNDPNTLIARNVVTSWGNVFTTGDDGRIADNQVTAAPGNGTFPGTLMSASGTRIVVENNVLNLNGSFPLRALTVDNNAAAPIDGITIRNNTILRTTGADEGIALFTPTTHLTVSGNTVNGGSAAGERFPDLHVAATTSQCTITNNHFDSTGTPAITYENLVGCTVSGNTRNGVPL